MYKQRCNRFLFSGVIFISFIVAPGLWAQENGERNISGLMEDKGCARCHDRTERRYGPPYKMIASLHAGKEGIIDRLAKKIIKGGMGTWGANPMPPSNNVTEEEARAMAQWIINLE